MLKKETKLSTLNISCYLVAMVSLEAQIYSHYGTGEACGFTAALTQMFTAVSVSYI